MMKENCPICKKQDIQYFESSHKEAFIHTIPYVGLMIYGSFSADKFIICQNDEYVHFGFVGADDERLVRLGVENSTTEKDMISAIQNFEEDEEWEGEEEEDFDYDEEETF